MIGDGHVFVVGQQRVVRAELPPRVGRVMDAGEEIGVVADARRQVHRAIGGAEQQPLADGLEPRAVGTAGVQQLRDRLPQRAPRPGAEREQRIERIAARGLGGEPGVALEQARLGGGSEVENLVPDRDAAARALARRAEHAERQVLDREIRVRIGRGDPTAPRRGVRVVGHAPRNIFGSPAQQAS